VGDKVKIIQGGHAVLTTNPDSSINLKLKCPAGHEVTVGNMGDSKPKTKAETEAYFAKTKAETEAYFAKMKAEAEVKRAEMEAQFAKAKAEMEAKKAEWLTRLHKD
jgi:hypothetical protein